MWKQASGAIAVLVAGSGILNLLSLLGGPVPTEQPPWVRELFPLDFAGFSNSITLLLGFALILVAIHLWGRKRRAWRLAIGLAAGSVLFHLTRGWDVEEAACSAALLAVLLCSGRHFRLGSARPSLRLALRRAVVALSVAAAYGVAGFWLLEPREFNHNFRWWDAALRAFRLMMFVGDSTLIPRTPYAVWFLDSLIWMSAAAFLYCGFVLFRPVAYRFRPNSEGASRAALIARRYGRSGQDFFKVSLDKSHFFSQSGESFLAYRVAGNYALAFGDPVGPEGELRTVVKEFVAYCQRRGWRAGFHQVRADQLEVYEALGFRRLKVGDDAIVDLEKFSLSGSAKKEFRNTVNRLDRLGFIVSRMDAPLEDSLLDELKRISDEWLAIPGHRERQFTLGRFDREYVRSTPVYVAYDGDRRPVAFLNLAPSYSDGLATVDLMRRVTETANGVMDYLFAKAFLDLKERGVRRFSMGMAPLAGVEQAGSELNAEERLARWTMARMPFLFRGDSLRRFKTKYADSWEPRYAVYQTRLDLPRFALALRSVTELSQPLGEAA